ncbi:MAG: transcriptional regulator [Candidatus Saccharibacteria bacterium]|nr:transcriptional regulator [Candidatus Saccharibacteria bacterium]
MSTQIEKRPGCLQATLDVLGDKWTPLILRDLTDQPATFSELEISLVGISPRTLSQRLTRLEQQQIIARDMYCVHPPRYKYHLTSHGQELQGILQKMAAWGERFVRA